MKKKYGIQLLGCLTILFCANFGSQESSDNGNKPAVNFYGTLTTWQGQEFSVENILLGKRYNKIPVYEIQPITDAQKKQDREFEHDPRDGIITKLDLAEIATLSIPDPSKIYTFQKRKNSRIVEYLEIVIASNDDKKTEQHYLIDLGRKLTCDQINQAGPIEKDVPLKAIKKLTIQGYRSRDESDNDKKCKNKKKKNNETAE